MQVLEHFLMRSVNNPDELRYTLGLLAEIFKTFLIDVSRFTDEEIQAMRESKVAPMLNLNTGHAMLKGQKLLDKGVDIGNQTSQIIGLIINKRKTRIVKLSGFYRHLQNGCSLTETGRGIRRKTLMQR